MLDVLVHCHDFEAFGAGPRHAARLAAQFDGIVTGLYVAPPLPLYAPPPGSAVLQAEFFGYVHEEVARAESAQEAFAAFAAGHGARSQWRVALGALDDALVAAANWNDLIVFEHRERVPPQCVDPLARALAGGVPCLVVREGLQGDAPGDRIAVAWNGSVESIRALHAALPLLQRATRIQVLTSTAAPRDAALVCEPDFALPGYLDRHGIDAEIVPLDTAQRSAEEAILIGAARFSADLLVMGAFGASRRDLHDHDGITRRVIEHAMLPLFLRH